MQIRNSKIKMMFILVIDMIGIIVSYILALLIRYQGFHIPSHQVETYYMSIFFVVIFAVLFAIVSNQSKNFVNRGYYEEFTYVTIYNVALAVSIGILLFAFQESENFSRLVFGYFLILNQLLLFLTRNIVKLILRMYFKSENVKVKVILITEHDYKEEVEQAIINAKGFNYEYMGAIISKTLDQTIIDKLKKMALDEVILYVPNLSNQEIKEFVVQLELMGVTIHVVLEPLAKNFYPQEYCKIGSIHTMKYKIQSIPSEKMIIKRSIDILGGCVGLIFTCFITIFVGLAIKIESKGPIFFTQERIGKNGRKFQIYKFRSMVVNAEQMKEQLKEKNQIEGLMFKMDNDPRITKVGKFIRKTSIDELPQFLNVLKGEMSLVGTRPPTVDEFENYSPYYKRRLSITPGLTGMWQVSGRSSIKNFDEVVKLDLEYIDNWSLNLDFKIILQTIFVVLFGRGAK